MTEKRQILILFSSTLLLGVSAFLFDIYLATHGNHAAVSDELNPFVSSGPFLVSVWAVLVLLLPFLFLALYFFFGREREPRVVPEFPQHGPRQDALAAPGEHPLHRVPVRIGRERFFRNPAGPPPEKKDRHDHQARQNAGVLIRVLDRGGTDPYEQRVMDFLSQFMSGNVFRLRVPCKDCRGSTG